MGTLDDAIREHLALKRSRGAADEEIEREEEAALGRGVPPGTSSGSGEPVEQAGADVGDSGLGDAGFQTRASGPASVEPADEELEAFEAAQNGIGAQVSEPAEPEELEAELRGAEPSPTVAEPESIDPDEVLPEEALELEPSALPEGPPSEDVGFAEPPSDRGADDRLLEDPSDDLLEETPEFLEESPGQDRLWFEQRPPKDFDFDD